MFIDDTFYDNYAEGAKHFGTPMPPEELKKFMNAIPPDDQKFWSDKFVTRTPHGLTKEYMDSFDQETEITQEGLDNVRQRIRGNLGGRGL